MLSPILFHQLFDPVSCSFSYLLADPICAEAILIDPVLENLERDLNLIQELQLKLNYVLDTHVHADHITAAGELRHRLETKVAMSEKSNVAGVDRLLKEGDQIHFGNRSLEVYETPGHTDSSLCFYSEGRVFTGDTLLVRGCGRTDLQGGSAELLYASVTEKLFTLPPETVVYPGHDYKGFTSSTIGAEMQCNPRLKTGVSRQHFIEIMTSLKLEPPRLMKLAIPANLAGGFRPQQSDFNVNQVFHGK